MINFIKRERKLLILLLCISTVTGTCAWFGAEWVVQNHQTVNAFFTRLGL